MSHFKTGGGLTIGLITLPKTAEAEPRRLKDLPARRKTSTPTKSAMNTASAPFTGSGTAVMSSVQLISALFMGLPLLSYKSKTQALFGLSPFKPENVTS